MRAQDNPAQRELLHQVEAVARECRSARRMRAVLRFSWVLFLVTLALTGVMYFLPATFFPTWAAYGVWSIAAIYAFTRHVVGTLRHPITIEQVALFIDEHHPELENRIVTAVQVDSEHSPSKSEWMMKHFLEEALPKLSHTSFRDEIDQRSFARYGTAAVCMLISSALLAISFSNLWFPNLNWGWMLNRQIADSGFTVEPGDARVRRGDSVMVWVRGADSHEKVALRWQRGSDAWTESTAQRSATDRVSFHEFVDIREPVRYQVIAGRASSQVFELTPWMAPEVAAIDLHYRYPDYLGRPEREVPNSGHVTALEGTQVTFDVRANRAVARAEMVMATGDRIPLESADGIEWKTEMTLAKNGSYQIELFDEDGTTSEFNRKYSITVQRDLPPDVRVAFPRGDGTVSLLEEVPFTFEVTDDYGFSEYGIEYQVSGKDPVRVRLGEAEQEQLKAKGEHLLPLEDLPLEVGDLITWTVWATDAKPGRAAHELTGDPYFLEIRPFALAYREAISNAGGGMGGGGDAEMLQKQRDIIIATWDLRRDLGYVEQEEFDQRRNVVRDSQSNIRDELAAVPATGPDAQQLILLRQAMQAAIDALNSATFTEAAGALSDAAAHEQRAYQLMLKLQGSDVEVGQQQGGGGGGGGQEERFGIDELELNRNRNFYEEEQSTQAQEQAIDQLAQQLKELARRQKLIEEEMAKLISELEQAKTDEEREELRRRLERLEEELRRNLEQLDEAQKEMASGEMSNDQTQQAQRAMREAREQMNQSLEDIQQERLQEARTSSARAMDALESLEDQLRQLSGGSAAERLKDLQEDLNDLREQQHSIAQQTEELREQHNSPSFEGQEELESNQKALEEEKRALAQDFVELMNEAGDLADRSRDSQELMSRALGDWLRETAQEGILEDIENSEPLVKYGVWDNAASEEENIARKLDKAAEGLEKVGEKLVEDELESKQMALRQLQELLEQSEQMTGGGEASEEQGEQGQQGEDGEQQARGQGEGEEEQEQPGPGQGQGEEQQEPGRSGGGEGEEQESEEQSGRGENGEQRAEAESQSGQEAGEGDSEGGEPGTQPSDRPGDRESPMEVGNGLSGEGNEARMREFIDRDYAGWLDRLRDTESLLPEGSDARREVARVREWIEGSRREWRERALAPQFDLFIEMADEPLREAASRLHREIEDELGENEFVLVDEGEVPHQYRRLVADYFKSLSGSAEED